jgi:hypothetical protein
LRILCIRRGESLGQNGLKLLAEMAEKEDFQIWMARLDENPQVGFVIEDGMIARRIEAK